MEYIYLKMYRAGLLTTGFRLRSVTYGNSTVSITESVFTENYAEGYYYGGGEVYSGGSALSVYIDISTTWMLVEDSLFDSNTGTYNLSN